MSDSELENSLQDLLDSSFDTETTWPSTERMPKLYAPKKILDLNRRAFAAGREMATSVTVAAGEMAGEEPG